MVLPFIEFATIGRINDFTLTGLAQLLRWESIIYDGSSGGNPPVWQAGDPDYLYVPVRPGGIQYGYAMVIASFEFTDPGANSNDITVTIDHNTAGAAPTGYGHRRLVANVNAQHLLVIRPWHEVSPGDWFETWIVRTGSGTAHLNASVRTWVQLILAGPQ